MLSPFGPQYASNVREVLGSIRGPLVLHPPGKHCKSKSRLRHVWGGAVTYDWAGATCLVRDGAEEVLEVHPPGLDGLPLLLGLLPHELQPPLPLQLQHFLDLLLDPLPLTPHRELVVDPAHPRRIVHWCQLVPTYTSEQSGTLSPLQRGAGSRTEAIHYPAFFLEPDVQPVD